MLAPLTEPRVMYRCRKTVLEMLRDRGYEIGDAEIEESYEDFEQRISMKHGAKAVSLNMIAKRPTPTGQNEPIFVVFAQDERLGAESLRSLLEFMDTWSKNNDDNTC